jgi:hypothetical protein
MHRVSTVNPDDLKMEVEVQPGQIIATDAATVHLIFSEASRGLSLTDAYEKFRVAFSSRYNCTMNYETAYLLVEGALRITNDLKKTHTS